MSEYQPIEKLADKIVQPGIEKHLLPLCLYRGTISFGRVHRWWNFAIAAMEQDCSDLTDLVGMSHNPDYSHLCGPERQVSRIGAIGFLSRLRDNPNVTANVPHLTEWAGTILPRPFVYERVSVHSAYQRCAPWRVYRPVKQKAAKGGGNVKAAPSMACYPYIAHDPKKDGFDLVARVNRAVPRSLPEDIRADICQDIIVAVLSGELTESDLAEGIKRFIGTGRRELATRWKHVPFDTLEFAMEGGLREYEEAAA